jgi:hypothetical protein
LDFSQDYSQFFAGIPIPSEKRARYTALREVAARLKAHLNMNPREIHEQFTQAFKTTIPGARTIWDWNEKVAYSGSRRDSLEWSVLRAGNLQSSHLRYLVSLDMLSSAIHGERGLTVDEARWAESLADVFGDTKGVEVDLLAQLAIIEEYARRDIEPPLPTDDLDIILATRPWEDEGDMYKVAISCGRAPTPILPMLIVDGPKKGDRVKYPSQLVGAVAHLGLPWIAMYRSGGRKGELRYVPAQPDQIDGKTSRTRQEWMSECNWKQIVKDKWKETSYGG